MSHNINTKSRGFTLIELLIVIVVIAILALISIVAYNGITTRANGAAAKGNAEAVQKVAETYNADDANSGYPTLAQLNGYTGMTRIPSGVTVAANSPSATNGKTTIGYKELGTTGGCIAYWDYQNSVVGFVYAGAAKTGGGASGAAVTCA